MATMPARISTAFTIAEVVDEARHLAIDLNARDEVPGEWTDIPRLTQAIAQGVWVPQFLDDPIVRSQIDAAISQTPLKIKFDYLAPAGEQVQAVTPGVLTNLRDRVDTAMRKANQNPDWEWVRYAGLTRVPFEDLKLWREFLSEGIIDFIFRRSLPGFELRQCPAPECGRWFEPQLAKRGRFCSAACRFKFNNIRQNKDKGQFTCRDCNRRLTCDFFAGLEYAVSDDVSDLEPSTFSGDEIPLQVCVDCVAKHHREWLAYIAPFYRQPANIQRTKPPVKR